MVIFWIVLVYFFYLNNRLDYSGIGVKLENTQFNESCIIDELNLLKSNKTKVLKGMKKFYNKTGVQPFLLIKASATYDVIVEVANNYYQNSIDNNYTFLYVIGEDGSGACVSGELAKTVMNNDAMQIFLSYYSDFATEHHSSKYDRQGSDYSVPLYKRLYRTYDWTGVTIMHSGFSAEERNALLALAFIIILAAAITIHVFLKED